VEQENILLSPGNLSKKFSHSAKSSGGDETKSNGRKIESNKYDYACLIYNNSKIQIGFICSFTGIILSLMYISLFISTLISQIHINSL
jgi:hypothetical protein